MLFVWGSDASTFLLAAKIHADHIKSGKKKAHSWVQHKNQSKINTVGGEASQNTRNTVQHQARPGDDSTFFLRESGLSSGTQKSTDSCDC